jgi:hypothetical protein
VTTRREDESELLAGGPGLAWLVYGHPVRLDSEGNLTRLFHCDVEAEAAGRGRCRVARVQPDQVVLNHHLFRVRGARLGELLLLQEELEGEFRSFGDRVRAVLTAPGKALLPQPAACTASTARPFTAGRRRSSPSASRSCAP